MATRIETLLTSARITLADERKERWSDFALLSILNEALIDFCQQTRILHRTHSVVLRDGRPIVSLPDMCWYLIRATYKDTVLPLRTYEEMDLDRTIATDWIIQKGEPKAIVYNQREMLTCRVWPIPNMSAPDTTVAPAYGVTVSYEDTDTTLTDSYGVVSGVEGNTAEVNVDLYGTLTSVLKTTDPKLTFLYVRRPNTIGTVHADLLIPSIYDPILKFYLCGHAFMNDITASYQEKGLIQLRLYEQQVKKAQRATTSYFTRTEHFNTTYRAGI